MKRQSRTLQGMQNEKADDPFALLAEVWPETDRAAERSKGSVEWEQMVEKTAATILTASLWLYDRLPNEDLRKAFAQVQQSPLWKLLRSVAEEKLSSWKVSGRLLMGPEWRNFYVAKDATGRSHEVEVVLRDALHQLEMMRMRAAYEARR